jgi:nitroreductase
MPLIHEPDSLRALTDARLLPRTGTARAHPAPAPCVGSGQVDGAPTRPLETVLAGRRSVRRFADGPVALADLVFLIEAAYAADLSNFATEPGGEPCLLVAAHALEGTQTGVYHYDRFSASFSSPEAEPLGDAQLVDQVRGAYCPAPVLLLICADVTSTDPDDLAYAHRRALIRAGAFGDAAWIAARTLGMECSVYGSGCRDLTRLLRRKAGLPARHLFTVAVGRPVSSSAQDLTLGPTREER